MNTTELTNRLHFRPTIRHGRAYVDSRRIAESFSKHHKNVLRSIEGLILIEPKLHGLNFEPMLTKTAIGNGAIREDKAYYVDRDGFALLVMGFTGRTSTIWKLRYIEAFNAMEAELAKRNLPASREYSAKAVNDIMDSRDLMTVAYTALQAEHCHDRDTIRAIAATIDIANRALELPKTELDAI